MVDLVTTCYVQGDPAIGGDAVVTWGYNQSGESGPVTIVADVSESGAVYGLTYRRTTEELFTLSVLKRHIAEGVGGLDAIYVMDMSSSSPSATVWLELEDDLGINVGQDSIGTNAERGVDQSPSHDVEAFDLVGKIGLGDMEISDDETTLFVMNILDKTVYAIDIATKTLSGTFPLPDPMCCLLYTSPSPRDATLSRMPSSA